MMHSYLYEKWLTDYSEETLPSSQRERLKRHISQCTKCQEILGVINSVDSIFAKTKPTVPVLSSDRATAIYDKAIAASDSHPRRASQRRSPGWPMWSFVSVGATAVVVLFLVNGNRNISTLDSRPVNNSRAKSPDGKSINPPKVVALSTGNRAYAVDPAIVLAPTRSTPVLKPRKARQIQLAQLINTDSHPLSKNVEFIEDRAKLAVHTFAIGETKSPHQELPSLNAISAKEELVPSLAVVVVPESLASTKYHFLVQVTQSKDRGATFGEGFTSETGRLANYAYASSRTTNDLGDVSVKETTQSTAGSTEKRYLKLVVQPSADKVPAQSLIVEATLIDSTIPTTKDK